MNTHRTQAIWLTPTLARPDGAFGCTTHGVIDTATPREGHHR